MDELIGSKEPSIEHHLSSETHSDIARRALFELDLPVGGCAA